MKTALVLNVRKVLFTIALFGAFLSPRIGVAETYPPTQDGIYDGNKNYVNSGGTGAGPVLTFLIFVQAGNSYDFTFYLDGAYLYHVTGVNPPYSTGGDILKHKNSWAYLQYPVKTAGTYSLSARVTGGGFNNTLIGPYTVTVDSPLASPSAG